jgi:methionyl-tRNA synthetase
LPKRYTVTAALPYSNNRLHVGHIAGAYLPADTYVRFLRACGHDVRFICGSDDNGVAIEITALQENSTPQQVSTFYHERQKADFAGLRIEFDIYGGTHQPAYVRIHERLSQDFFRRIHAQGYFTKRRTKQLYDPHADKFLPDRFVRGTCHHCGYERATGDQCDQCTQMIDPLLLVNPISVISGKPAEVRETTHWYLRLSRFEKPLADWLESKQGHWRPTVLNFSLGQIKQGLPERSMTRDIEWGIPVPLEDPDARGKVLYVWFDAPIGYLSFTASWCEQNEGDWRGYERWWCDPDCEIIHFIGEDNTVFHALTWPAMLMAEGRHQLPGSVVANNFINYRVGGQTRKISKSESPPDSPVWIEEYLKRYDPDALRYYLTAIAPEAARTTFDPADFVARNNNELVAALGNFVNRWPKFAIEDFGGKVPDAAGQTDADRAQLAAAAAAIRTVGEHLEGCRFRAAIEELMAFARSCNNWIGLREPWKRRRDNPADCAACIATCIHIVHHLAILCWPFMPTAAERMLTLIGLPPAPPRWETPPPPPAGRPIGAPAILFAKIEGL